MGWSGGEAVAEGEPGGAGGGGGGAGRSEGEGGGGERREERGVSERSGRMRSAVGRSAVWRNGAAGSATLRSRVHVGLGAARGGEAHEVRVGAAPHTECYTIVFRRLMYVQCIIPNFN